MSDIISCEFNIDTSCIELLFADGSTISMDCTTVENEIAGNRFDRSELHKSSSWLCSREFLQYSSMPPLFNHRLLSELICHKDFQRLMLDAGSST